MAHTPGPWTIGDVQWIMHQQSGLGYSYRPINAGSWELAQVWEDDHDAEMTANVHLISAAPELLAALQDAKTELISLYEEVNPADESDNYTTEVIDRVIAAIEKATGENTDD